MMLFLYMFVFLNCLNGVASAGNNSVDILNKLFHESGYDAKVPPYPYPTSPVSTWFYIKISHIEDVNESEGTMTIHGSYYHSWVDNRIKWVASSTNGRPMYIPINNKNQYYQIWKPQMQMGNAASGSMYRIYSEKEVIYSMGLVYVKRMFTIKTNCHFDFSAFPKDTQICPLIFWQQDPISNVVIRANYTNAVVKRGSWHDGDGGGHVFSGHWKFITLATKMKYFGWNGLVDSTEYPDKISNRKYLSTIIEVFLEVKRHDPYIGVIVYLPLIVTCILSIGGVVTRDDKLSIVLLLSGLLVETMGLWGLRKKLPPVSGTVPTVVVVYGLDMCLIIVSLLYYMETQRAKQLNSSHQATQADQDHINEPPSHKYITVFRFAYAIAVTSIFISSVIVLYA